MRLSNAESYQEVSAHGCLMTIAWIIFASTGILLVRYYSNYGRLIYAIHILFSILVQLASLAGFFIIFGLFFKWSWLTTVNNELNDFNYKLGLAHSIFGITAILISILQVKYLKLKFIFF